MNKEFDGEKNNTMRKLLCRAKHCKCETFPQAWDCALSEYVTDMPNTGTSIPASSVQVGGDHYLDKKIQPWDAMQAWMTEEAFEGFLAGNAIKYLARYKDKGGKADVEKAAHYLQKLLEVMG